MIQLHRLEGFYWVARTGGYARAARAFPYPITQPAVHQQVKKLEAELGLELFERVGKDRVQPTPAGARLFEFTAPFFEGLPPLLRSLSSGDYGGVLHVHASTLLLRNLLPSWVKRLQRRFPGIRVELREQLELDLSILRRGKADLLVDYLPEVPDDVAVMQVATLSGFVVYPASHRLSKSKRVAIKEFAGDTFVSYTPGTLAHDLQHKGLAMHGLEPEKSVTAGSVETILGFVEAGLGFSLVPSLDAAGPKGHGIEARPITSPKVAFPVYAAWRKDTPQNPLLDAALETAPRP